MRRRKKIYPLSAEWWNGLVDGLFRDRIVELRENLPRVWRHPWELRGRWNAGKERWEVNVAPGFCVSDSGRPVPVVTMAAGDAPTRWREMQEILGLEVPEDPEEIVEVPLDEVPWVPLGLEDLRPVGTDGPGGSGDAEPEAVPGYFRDRGVVDGLSVEVGPDGESVVVEVEGAVADRNEARLLRAFDVVLRHSRLRTAGAVVEGFPPEVEFRLEVPPGRRRDPWVELVDKRVEFEPASALDLLLGSAVDEGVDDVLLGTGWLLSPPGADAAEAAVSGPDGSWEFHFLDGGFPWDPLTGWNVRYVQRFAEVTVPPQRLGLLTAGLAGGAGVGMESGLVAELESRDAEVARIYSRVEARGEFVAV